MCEYCNDEIYDSRESGFNYSPVYHLRQPFTSNAVGIFYLSTLDVPEGNSEYIERVVEEVDGLGGIGRWGMFAAGAGVSDWSPVGYCPMCGRKL